MKWKTFQEKLCSLDLEADYDGNIFAVGAVFQNKTFQRKAPFAIAAVLKDLDQFIKPAEFILGHNILRHDLPVCQAINPNLVLFDKPVIDTLYFSPLAFPENPYHRLVKDYKLVRDSLNDPLADAKLALTLFEDQWTAFQQQHAETGLLSFYHFAFSDNPTYTGLQLALLAMGAEPLNIDSAIALFQKSTRHKVCQTVFDSVLNTNIPDPERRVNLAYCLAWILVAGGNSILPAWVHKSFHHVAPILRQLRDIPCQSAHCQYCRETHDPVAQLQRYFGFSAFRSEPPNPAGGSLQQNIVEAGISDSPVFAILPTGGGKSLCFQLPALVRYQRRG
ncbi:MAG: RecQ family ATP-dependent DNA helicase, partial [Gammaproteobacteria bacterium]|nr:RecQ family ATP-dependent DNA helicase [Gammaproteobacteria bacterium]